MTGSGEVVHRSIRLFEEERDMGVSMGVSAKCEERLV